MNFISLVNISVGASASSGFSHLPCCLSIETAVQFFKIFDLRNSCFVSVFYGQFGAISVHTCTCTLLSHMARV